MNSKFGQTNRRNTFTKQRSIEHLIAKSPIVIAPKVQPIDSIDTECVYPSSTCIPIPSQEEQRALETTTTINRYMSDVDELLKEDQQIVEKTINSKKSFRELVLEI